MCPVINSGTIENAKSSVATEQTIIFYGIPSEENVARNIDKWIRISGRQPSVFVEKDENLHKHNGKLLDRYDVISLDEALKNYPDADIWITHKKCDYSANMLSRRMNPSKIHFLEADLEYRKGCSYLGNFISYRKNNFSPCCVTGRCPVVNTTGTIRERFAQWQTYTERLVDDIRQGVPNKCDGCHLLKYGMYKKSVRLSRVSFGSNNPGDVCNFKCVYCFSEGALERLKDDEDGFTTYEVIKQISEMPEYDTDDFTIQLSNGEFTANKYCDEILDIFLKRKWKIDLVTNLSIYKEKLAQLMDTGRVKKTLVSMDAGTPETFKAVKKNDAWDRVVSNLKKYPVDKANLLLKYIFLEGLNDNEADIDGFYELVKDVGCKTMVLSSDLNAPWTGKMRELAFRIIKRAKADGVHVSTNSSYLNPNDANFIRDCLNAPN